MKIRSTERSHRKRRHALRRGGFAVAAAAALALVLVAPTTGASAAKRNTAQGSGNKYNWQDFQLPTFQVPGQTFPPPLTGADQLLTGSGTGCPPPDPLPAHNAGESSGAEYEVPFLIKLTNGRLFVGHSIGSYRAGGQLPFRTTTFGLTGWVQGYVHLPSLKVSFPPSGGVLLCHNEALVTQANADAPVFNSLSAWPDQGAFFRSNFDATVVGTPSAALVGVAADGSLEMSASVTVHAVGGVKIFGAIINWECANQTSLTLNTKPQPLITKYAPQPNPYDIHDDSLWSVPLGTGYRVASKAPSFPPPQKNWLPTSNLTSATDGGTGSAGSVSFVVPYFQNGPGLSCNPSQAGVQDQLLDPIDPKYNLPFWLSASGLGAGQYHGDADLDPGPMNPGSGQASIGMTVASIGLQSGMPSGFGFSR